MIFLCLSTMHSLILLGFGLLLAFAAHSAESGSADPRALAQAPYWHKLLHYRHDFLGRWRSEAYTPSFFLSPRGKTDPAAEFDATLAAMRTDAAGDASAACRFPARRRWLVAQGLLPATAPDCPALHEWLTGINPDQATLIFAADYLNNPSSAFGHTLLRIDTPGQSEDSRLLSYAINFAANTNESNGVLFAYHGLTGGYPGQYSVMAYYQKVREYSDLEDRDLWEYRLSLSREEIVRMLEHLWELKGVAFPYYFLLQNCSWQLLGLLDIAREGLELQQHFGLYAIPTDTLRTVVDTPGMLAATVYRPSAGTKLLYRERFNSRPLNAVAAKLAEAAPGQPAPTLPARDAVAALETAHDLLYYRFLAHDVDPKVASTRLRELLLQRSRFDIDSPDMTPPRPAQTPAEGHLTRRLRLAAYTSEDDSGLLLGLRPAYHDLVDPHAGYRRGAQINFLDGELAWSAETERMRLNHLTLVGIDSLPAHDAFLTPMSWYLDVGWRRLPLDRQGDPSRHEQHLNFQVIGGAGATFSASAQVDCHALFATQLLAGPVFDHQLEVGFGPRLGCHREHDRWSWQIDTTTMLLAGGGHSLAQHRAEIAWHANRANSVRLKWRAEGPARRPQNQIALGWHHYF